MSDDFYTVRDARRRVLFEASQEEDARKYVEDHFPRHHIELGGVNEGPAADVVLTDPDGVHHVYHGGKWVEDVEHTTEDGRFIVKRKGQPAKVAKATPVK